MRSTIWKVSLLTLLLGGSCLAAQIPAARFQISGSTTKAGSLSLAQQPPTGLRQVQIHLQPSPERTIEIPLVARSNSPYRLIVSSSVPVRVLLKSVDPNGGTSHLAPEAMIVHAIEAEASGSSGEIAVLDGPRISTGGNDSTSDNAIRLTVQVELPDNASDAELTFRMEF